MSEQPEPIEVLGAATCEDTAIVRSRLRALGVAFRDVDIDADPAALERVVALNGWRVTPTVVVGDAREVAAEPSLERLGELLAAAGHAVPPPGVVEYHGELTRRAIPLRSLPTDTGEEFSPVSLRGQRQVALFLAHGVDCLACFGYAKQLARHAEGLDEAEATAIVAVPARQEGAGGAADWRHEVGPAAVLVDDPGGEWKAAVGGHVGAPPDRAILLLLDRYLAPRVGSAASEAGGLVDPSAAVGWLRYLLLECPECAGEIAWTD